eukprot:15432234-Alexandrium_andersonii.AAC.1
MHIHQHCQEWPANQWQVQGNARVDPVRRPKHELRPHAPQLGIELVRRNPNIFISNTLPGLFRSDSNPKTSIGPPSDVCNLQFPLEARQHARSASLLL